MCLAPEVDLAAGAAITVVAVDAVRHNPHRRSAPLALLPGIFALHTFTSAAVWWGLQGRIPQSLGDVAVGFFVFVAYILLPVYLPVAVLLLEPPGWRRYALTALLGAGVLSAAEYLHGLVSGSASAVACDFYIDYSIGGVSTYTGALYVVATVGALLLSGDRTLALWGVVNAAAVAVLVVTARAGLPSLWCFWAACTSVFVAYYLRRLQRRHAAGHPWPWQAPDSTPARSP